MNEQTDWSAWFSTYGFLTAERILERYNIKSSHDELINALEDPGTIYFHLLYVPLKNVFNGILLRQVHDYQIYAQKLLVDYLLSGADSKENEEPGGETRSDLEIERLKLIEAGDEFHKQEELHQTLIIESQAVLVDLTRKLDELNAAQLDQHMETFAERAKDNNINLRSYRSQFYNLILRITELLRLVPDYHMDQAKIIENRSSLEFDAQLGEE